MGSLKVTSVKYSGDRYWFESPELKDGLSIIEGPNGTGKSTFFNLIYYALGGKVEEFERGSLHAHKEITSDTSNFVRVGVAINEVRYSLTRKIGDTSIAIDATYHSEDDSSVALVLPIFRQSADYIFSDWLLERLEIAVVEIFQGGRSFKLNFTDLARLIYHNQSPDPNGVFKPADASNFISDSLEVRRAIFQVLVGKTLLALYQAIGRQKHAERDKDSARAILIEYTQIVAELLSANGIKEVTNQTHLLARIHEMQQQLEKLGRERSARVTSGVGTDEIVASFEMARRRYEAVSVDRAVLDEKLTFLFREKARLDEVQVVLNDDIHRIQKILYTHEQLKLFSADTCPYCLNTVERAKDRCVCGCVVDEKNYQRFFYSAAEYIDILKSKAKSLETMRSAVEGVRDEISRLARSRDDMDAATEDARVKLICATEESLRPQDEYIELIEEKMFELRNVISELEQALKLEEKLAELQRRYDSAASSAQNAKAEVAQLDAAARVELSSRLGEFNSIYTSLMTAVLVDCRTAKIDPETYLPVINNGEYREASADVPKRFLYYLALLRMSLNEDIPFPRILLVDTPETAGIDLHNLVLMLRQIDVATKDHAEFQILLSTGEGKFPQEYADRVAVRLRKDSRLLHERSTQLEQPPGSGSVTNVD